MTPDELYHQTQNMFRHRQRRFVVRMAKEFKAAGLSQVVLRDGESHAPYWQIRWFRKTPGTFFATIEIHPKSVFGLQTVIGGRRDYPR